MKFSARFANKIGHQRLIFDFCFSKRVQMGNIFNHIKLIRNIKFTNLSQIY